MSTNTLTAPGPAGLFVAGEIPGEWLQIQWRGEPPRLWTRRLASLALALAGLAWVNVVWYVIQEWGAGRPGQKNDDLLLPAIMAAMSLFFFHYAGGAIAGIVGYWRELSWEAATNRFNAERRGWLIWGNQTRSLTLESICDVTISMTEEQSESAELMVVTDKEVRTTVDLAGLALDRTAAQELCFSIARIIKAQGYLPAENTPSKFRLQVWRTRVDCLGDDEPDDDDEAEEFLPIPPPGKTKSIQSPGRPKPHDTVKSKAALDLERVAKSLTISRIDTWRPGELVRVVRPSAPWFVYVLVIGVILVPAFLVGRSWVFSLARLFVPLEDGARWAAAGFTMSLTGSLVGFWLWNNLKTREVIFDWTRRRLTLRFGPTLRHWSFAEIRELLLAEKLHNECPDDPETQTPYRVDGYGAALHLVLPGEELLLIETEIWEKEQDVARELLAPLGATLAKALPVRYSRGQPKIRDGDRVAKALRLTRPQQVILGLIALFALSLLISTGLRHSGRKQIIARLQETGVEARAVGRYEFDHHEVLQNYVSIRFPDRRILNEHGDEIRALLAQLPAIALDLEQSNLTDADLEPLRGLPIKMVHMADTKLGDTALEILTAGDGLEFLDADGTPITDQSVPALLRQPNLRFVFFRRTGITFQGAGRLHGKDSVVLSAP